MGWNLDDYETVAELNRWFQDNYPLGRQRVEVLSDNPSEERMVIWAAVYRDINDPHPAVENITRGKQSDYPRPMQRFYAEDLATSAIGRCIALLKATKTATRDDMEKLQPNGNADRNKQSDDSWTSFVKDPLPSNKTTRDELMPTLDQGMANLAAALGAEVVESIPHCEHGEMRLKEGTSSKTNKPYRGYVCTWSKALGQCKPMWQVLTSQGTWRFDDKDAK